MRALFYVIFSLTITTYLSTDTIAAQQSAATINVYTSAKFKETLTLNSTTLVDLITHPQLQFSTDWLSAVLAEENATQQQKIKQQTAINQLTQLIAYFDNEDKPALANSSRNLLQQISTLQVTGRQFTSLDPDWIRLNKKANLRLAGNYTLYAPPNRLTPKSQIEFFGLVSNAPYSAIFKAEKRLSDYLSTLSITTGADKNNVWLITADGQSESVPIAYWNNTYQAASPRSTVFIPFAENHLPARYHSLNQHILSLLQHRIPHG